MALQQRFLGILGQLNVGVKSGVRASPRVQTSRCCMINGTPGVDVHKYAGNSVVSALLSR